MTSVAVATSSQLAAEAAYEVAEAGGNAVDCALAAALLTMNTEPGVCALAGGTFITIWKNGSAPITIDGNVTVPGKGLRKDQRGNGAEAIAMDYGGGINTLVGCGSVAVPGSLAAIEHAWNKFGAASWRSIFAPSIRATRDGFPLSAACHYYLTYSRDCVFGRSDDGHSALHEANGMLRDSGSRIVIPGLHDTLDALSKEGARLFYEGELAASIAEHCGNGDGMLTREDLASYRALEREPLLSTIGQWKIATNPPPAVGGAVLSAMLLACTNIEQKCWNQDALRQLIQAQRSCLDFRKRHLDLTDDVGAEAARLLAAVHKTLPPGRCASASTVHTSAVDSSGNGCAITASSGYGSGEMPDGTGLWLNNCLGELELNRRGLAAGPVGSRLPSNMTPAVARTDGAVIAVGSPGADRITTAMQQFLINYLQFGMPLDAAMSQSRLHVDTSGAGNRLMAEPGLELPDTDLPVTVFPQQVMYFGGVCTAVFDSNDGLSAAADPRREGGTCIFDN